MTNTHFVQSGPACPCRWCSSWSRRGVRWSTHWLEPDPPCCPSDHLGRSPASKLLCHPEFSFKVSLTCDGVGGPSWSPSDLCPFPMSSLSIICTGDKLPSSSMYSMLSSEYRLGRALFISSHNWEIPNLEVILLLYTVHASPIVKITRSYFRGACERNTFKLYDA